MPEKSDSLPNNEKISRFPNCQSDIIYWFKNKIKLVIDSTKDDEYICYTVKSCRVKFLIVLEKGMQMDSRQEAQKWILQSATLTKRPLQSVE